MEQTVRELFERKSVRAFENKDIEPEKRNIKGLQAGNTSLC